jgi:GT2 family glycosyltransferase
MEKHLVSIVIVNWNGLEYLKSCFTSINKIKTRHKIEIIVVDNASKDKSVEWLKTQSGNWPIRIVQNNQNLGFAEGNNKGVSVAKGDLILFLNNDTIVEPNFLDILINSLNSKRDCAAVQPKILQLTRKNYIDSIGSYFTSSGFLYHFGHNKPDQKKYNNAAKIFSMKGACMLFKKKVLDEIGIFDKNFFAYFEESDLCLRALIAGYTLWYEPNAQIYHKGGGTSQDIQAGFVLMHSYKNRLQTYLKNFQIKTLVKILPIHMIFMLIVVLMYVVTLKFDQALGVFKGLVWAFSHLSYIAKQRKEIAKLRKVDDDFFLSELTRNVRPSYFYHLITTSLTGYKD